MNDVRGVQRKIRKKDKAKGARGRKKEGKVTAFLIIVSTRKENLSSPISTNGSSSVIIGTECSY